MNRLTVLTVLATVLTATACGGSSGKHPSTPDTTFKDGTFKVGLDIKSGTYAVYHPGVVDCAWMTSTDHGGNHVEDAGDKAKPGDTLTAVLGHYVTTGGGCEWIRRPG